MISDKIRTKETFLLSIQDLTKTTEIDSGTTYTISNNDELNHFATLVNGGQTCKGATIKLLSDISLGYWRDDDSNGIMDDGEIFVSESFKTPYTKSNWTPIGFNGTGFAGSFDGGNHTISGIYIKNPKVGFQGLFGYVSNGGKVKNVNVSKSYIYSCEVVGGIVGNNDKGTVSNCFNSGTINGKNYSVGGVIGCNDGTMEFCYNTGTIKCGNNSVGGVAGANTGTIISCYNIGQIYGVQHSIGGLVGANTGTVNSCYSTGIINGSAIFTGGVVGFNDNNSTITKTYYYGCDVGVCYALGVNYPSQEGTTPFVKIKDNPLGVGEATSVDKQHTCPGTIHNNIRAVWGKALGNDFTLNYGLYNSSNPDIECVKYQEDMGTY